MKTAGHLKNRILSFVAVCLIAFTSGAWSDSNAQESLGAAERRGKQIYFQGTSASGKPVLAYLGENSLEVPASALTCASCHGVDGQGKPEGGVIPSNITWEAMTKPYGVTHASGRKHPPYTNRGVELALTRGMDPAGNKLLGVMPRYSMSREDMADLILYLGRLGKDADPGVHESKIVIGTLVPKPGPLGELGQVMRSVTAAVVADVNVAGGIYNRRLELRVTETGETPAATLLNLERSFTAEPVFAMTGSFIAGSEKEVLGFSNQKELPMIGPFTLYPRAETTLPSRVFYLLSGIDDQSRALVEFALKKPEIKSGGIAIVYPRNEYNTPVVEAIQRQGKLGGLAGADVFEHVAGGFDAAPIVKVARQRKREAVFFLGSGNDALSFMREAEKAGWFPFMFFGGPAVAGDTVKAPAGFDGRIFISFPNTPADQTTEGVSEFRAFITRHKLPATHIASQMSAYTAAKLLVEGLKIAGKDLTREKLIQALEGLYEYRTGLTPPITYGPNRRIGALGAYVITVNLKEQKFLPASGWIGLGPPK